MTIAELQEKINNDDTQVEALIELCKRLEAFVKHTHDCNQRSPLGDCYCGLKDLIKIVWKI